MSFKKRSQAGNKKPRNKGARDSDDDVRIPLMILNDFPNNCCFLHINSILEHTQEDSTTVVKPIEHIKTSALGFQSTGSKKPTEVSSAVGSSVTTVFESSRELVPQSYAGNATHTSQVDTAEDRL